MPAPLEARITAPARIYPSLDTNRWYPVDAEELEPPGVWIDAGLNDFVHRGRRFIVRSHVELRPAPAREP